MKDDTANVFKSMIQADRYKKASTITLETIYKLLNSVNNSVINGFKQLLNNQTVLNNKLDLIINNMASKNSVGIIRYLTPRQLYFMVKDGYTYEQICAISGLDINQLMEKINSYISTNT